MKTSSRRSLTALHLACPLLLSLPLLLTSPAPAAIAPVETTVLAGGSTLLVRSDNIAPRVAISLQVRVGAADETPANAGWRQVLSTAVLRATRLDIGEKDPEQPARYVTLSDLKQRLEEWGGDMGATVDDDAIEFWITGDSRYSAELLRLLMQVVAQPRLSDEDFAAARRRVLVLQAQSANNLAARASSAIAGRLYRGTDGKPAAYALPNFGSFESLGEVEAEQLRQWHARYFVPSQFVIAASGDVDSVTLKNEFLRIRHTFYDDASGTILPETKPEFAALKSDAKPAMVVVSGGGAWVFAAFRTPAPSAMTPEENAALEVLTAALEGSAQARLPRRLLGDADKPFDPTAASNALAAQTAANWTKRRYAGELTVFAQTGSSNIEAVKTALLDEVRKLQEAPLSAIELQSAKDFTRGRWAVERDTLHERAFRAGRAAVHSTSADSQMPVLLDAVTAKDVQEAARKYLRESAVVNVIPQ